jgi:hypothetical protein
MNPGSNMLIETKTNLVVGVNGFSLFVTKSFFVVLNNAMIEALIQQAGCIEAIWATLGAFTRNRGHRMVVEMQNNDKMPCMSRSEAGDTATKDTKRLVGINFCELLK